jgi:hypothetical protein
MLPPNLSFGEAIGFFAYCMGYHNGAIQANRDYKVGNNLDVDQHRCTAASALYCNGYNRGYSDQADFLG